MAWSLEFSRQLAEPTVRPIYVLQCVRAHPWEVNDPTYRDWAISSDVVDGVHLRMIGEAIDSSGAEVAPRDWTSSVGSWSVEVVGPMARLLPAIQRGQFVELRVGFAGWQRSQFQTVQIGQVWGVEGHSGRWVIQMRDVLATLGTRQVPTADLLPLFATVGVSTTVAASYSAGSGSLQVAATSSFRRQDDGTGTLKGLIKINDTFYRTWTATATGPIRFTVNTDATLLGTSDAAASVGQSVVEYFYLDDHPINIARKIMVSTGTAGANGDYDVLPARWSYALPGEWVDHADMDRMITRSTPATGSSDWFAFTAEEQADGYAWLESLLSAGGFFLTMRQGAITCRAAVKPSTTKSEEMKEITRDHVIDIESFEAWPSEFGVEYARTKVTTAGGGSVTTGETVGSFPSETLWSIDLAPWVFDNESEIRQEVAGRVSQWALRVPERLVLTCTQQMAALAPGDCVLVTLAEVTGRMETGDHGYQRRVAWVASVSPDWVQWRTRLVLYVMPTTADAFVTG